MNAIIPTDQDHVPGATPSRQGKLGWAMLWLLGIPVPVLLILFLVRGCT